MFSLREYIRKIGQSAIELWLSKWTDRSISRLWSELIPQENDWNGERKRTAYTGEHGGWKRWLTSRAPTCNQGSWFSWWVIVSISTNFNTVTVFYRRFLPFLGITRLYDHDTPNAPKKFRTLFLTSCRNTRKFVAWNFTQKFRDIFTHDFSSFLSFPPFFPSYFCRSLNYELASGPVISNAILCKISAVTRCRNFHEIYSTCHMQFA